MYQVGDWIKTSASPSYYYIYAISGEVYRLIGPNGKPNYTWVFEDAHRLSYKKSPSLWYQRRWKKGLVNRE